MKNVIFISPNFPVNYWQFCHELQYDGVNVLGIGDQPYDELRYELKSWNRMRICAPTSTFRAVSV